MDRHYKGGKSHKRLFILAYIGWERAMIDVNEQREQRQRLWEATVARVDRYKRMVQVVKDPRQRAHYVKLAAEEVQACLRRLDELKKGAATSRA